MFLASNHFYLEHSENLLLISTNLKQINNNKKNPTATTTAKKKKPKKLNNSLKLLLYMTISIPFS